MAAELIIVDSVDSTNTAVKQRFETLSDGSCFCALEQRAGRGRLGRRWVTPPGKALCFSALLKDVSEAYHAGAIVALAALELLKKYAPGCGFFFKWPNDIYVGKNKLAGILSEGIIAQNRLSGVVSGIGININQSKEELEQLDNPATSLFNETGCQHEVTTLCQELFEHLQLIYSVYHDDPGEIIRQWQRANALIGHKLTVVRPDGTPLCGNFTGITPDGAMLLEVEGSVVRFDCGDVKIDPESLPEITTQASQSK